MRDKNEFIKMNKSSVISQLRSLKDSILHGPPHYSMGGLTDENWLSWFFKNLWNLGNTHAAYPSYPGTGDNQGIFRLENNISGSVKIALLSDWASDTPESHLIADQCGAQDYSIHLGDTYYVGKDKEIAYNFKRGKGAWPYGSSGSFAMLGNHEMYSSGKSYFTQLLPAMGVYKGSETPAAKQYAPYFCLENDFWRIVGLDTGYWSLKGWLGLSPNTNLELHKQQKAWLAQIFKDKNDKRGLILLSHHQCFSAFEPEFPSPMKTISNLLQPSRDVLWLWGHEHWFSVYGPNPMQNGSNVYARCIGNSGMPVELNDKNGKPKKPKSPNPGDAANRNLVLYDQRQREVIQGNISLGYNGYTILSLDKANLTLSYYDDNNKQAQPALALEENWSINLTTGKLTGIAINDHTLSRNQRLTHNIPDISRAIGNSKL